MRLVRSDVPSKRSGGTVGAPPLDCRRFVSRLVRQIRPDQFGADILERLGQNGAVRRIVVVIDVGCARLQKRLGGGGNLGTDGVDFDAFCFHGRAKRGSLIVRITVVSSATAVYRLIRNAVAVLGVIIAIGHQNRDLF